MKAEKTTERQGLRRDPRAGFTLIEVLAAMIILAVGLLGLQSLSIYAARSVILAERQSEYTLVASRHLEAALDSLSRQEPVACGTSTWPAGINTDRVRRTVSGAARERAVTVQVVPDSASQAVRPRLFELQTHVYLPNASSC